MQSSIENVTRPIGGATAPTLPKLTRRRLDHKRWLASALIASSLLMASCSSVPSVTNSARNVVATANAIVSSVANEATPTPRAVPPTAPAAQRQTPQNNQTPTTRVQGPEPTLAPIPTAVPAQFRQNYDEEERVLINLYERANPSVVYIEVGRGVNGGSGSGFVIDKRGHIVTNNHVIEQAAQVDVIFSDGTRVPAKIIGRDSYADLAVIKVNVAESRLIPLEFADSNAVKPGQKVIALGNPFGLQGTMTTGIVSAVGRALPERGESTADGGVFTNPDIIQTDAAINPGNSGGPLLDSRGRLIGVNTAIRTSNTVGGQASNSGVGFAVPSNTVKRIYPALIEEGRYRYPYLGINMRAVDDSIADQFQLPVRRGVLVSDLVQGGPAAQAGLRGIRTQGSGTARSISELGDIIIALNGSQVKDSNDLISQLSANTRPGDMVNLTIIRDGKQSEIKVKLGERPR